MALMHVSVLDVMPRELLVIELVAASMPAIGIKVPSIMDVVITKKPAEQIQVILKQELISVAAENGDGQIVDTFIGVVLMRRKFLARKRPTDVIGGTKSSV